jgi:hypothetical protein
MSDRRASGNLGDTIGPIIGLPIVLFFLVIWSPFLLLVAIFNLFSPDEPKPVAQGASQTHTGSATKTPGKPMSKGSFLLVAAALFAVFGFLLTFKSGGSSGGATSRGGGYNSPAYSIPSRGPVWVNGYYQQDGTYVPGHYRSAPDGDPSNNWSNSPNVNPYTGKPGTHHPKSGR